jgi:hypothetical protein
VYAPPNLYATRRPPARRTSSGFRATCAARRSAAPAASTLRAHEPWPPHLGPPRSSRSGSASFGGTRSSFGGLTRSAMPRALGSTESPPDGLHRPLLLLSSTSEQGAEPTDQSVEMMPQHNSLQPRSSRGSSGGSPGSTRSSGSPSSVRPISMRAGGVTERHEQALLPYSLMHERRALAAELRVIFAKCTEAFVALPRVPGRDQAASAADCRKAMAELCSPRSCRPGAFVLTKVKFYAVVACCTCCLIGTSALLAAVTSWDAFPVYIIYGGMAQALVTIIVLAKFVPDRSDSWLAKLCKQCWSMEDTKPDSLALYCDNPSTVAFGDRATFLPDEGVRDETPLDTTTSVVTLPLFLSRCMMMCVPRTRGKERILLVNFGGEVDASGYPIIDFLYIRKAWCSLTYAENKTSWDRRTVIDVAVFAAAATRCNFCYTSADVESIAAYIGTPDQMNFSEFIVLQMCLGMNADLGPKDQDRLMDSLGTVKMELLDDAELDVRALLHYCATEFEAKTASLEDSGEFGVPEVCDIAFGDVLLPWLAPRQTERKDGYLTATIDDATATWEAAKEKWKQPRMMELKDYCVKSQSSRDYQPLGLGQVLDAAVQLYFDGQGQQDGIAKVHAARACYEFVAGSLDEMADPNELLSLMYGYGTLLDDEKRKAMEILGAENSAAVWVDLEQPTNSATVNGTSTGRATSAPADVDVALDKVQRIKRTQSASQENALLVDFGSWLQFAMANGIPASPTAEAFKFDHDMRKLQQQRLREDSAQTVAHGSGYGWELFFILSGWKGYREAWMSHKRDPIGERLLATSVLGTVLFLCTTLGPWYWTVFSWHITGTVPLYFAWSPLLLVVPACHFYAQVESEASPDKAASRLRLISATSSDGASTSISLDEVWDLIERTGEEKKRRFTEGPKALFTIATVEMLSLLGFSFAVLPDGPLHIVQVVPSYLNENPHCTFAIGLWCFLYQCLFIVSGALNGQRWQREVEGKLQALNRVVTCSPPIIDFSRPENIVAWCRLRDHTAQRAGQSVEGKSTVTAVAKVSVAWAVLSALASIALTVKGAARTPYRNACAWFGLIGGATAIIQLLCLTSCDRAVEAQAAMLESQLERVQQTLVMRDRLGSDDEYTAAAATTTSALRTAASLIQADLDSYRNAPERRYYHLFGFPATFVLKSVGGFLATQVAVYAWNYLSTLSVQHDGSGSSGLEEECRIFMELEGC